MTARNSLRKCPGRGSDSPRNQHSNNHNHYGEEQYIISAARKVVLSGVVYNTENQSSQNRPFKSSNSSYYDHEYRKQGISQVKENGAVDASNVFEKVRAS